MRHPERISLLNCIGKSFYKAFWHVMEHDFTHYNFVGGRGSLKSSFISIMIVLLIMYDQEFHAVCYRKVAETLGDSVYDQILWAIDILGVGHLFKPKISPREIIYKPTGQRIIFRGLDKAEKSKSLKVKFGYIAIAWFEELDEYAGIEELRKVLQSVLRGGEKFWIFRSMNPPRSSVNWANDYIQTESLREDVYTSHTTYLTAPREWLGKPFIEEAEHLKKINLKAYEHEYLGKIVGTGSEVFDNLDIRKISKEERERFDHIYMGLDWGWYPDPLRWVKMHYDANRRILYFIDEWDVNKMSNQKAAEYLLKYKKVGNEIITCDSAEPKSVADFRAFGINARAAEKGPNSVSQGLKWYQGLTKIVIDPITCPKTAKEFKLAQYEITRNGEVLNTMPDKDNHSIDAGRYGMERVWKRRGN